MAYLIVDVEYTKDGKNLILKAASKLRFILDESAVISESGDLVHVDEDEVSVTIFDL